MIISYPKHGNGDEFIIDTENLDVKQVCDWAASILKAKSWKFLFKKLLVELGVPDTGVPNETIISWSLDVQFEGVEPDVFGQDFAIVGVRELIKHPENIVRSIALDRNVPGFDPDNLKYNDPDTPKPGQEDWQVAGSPLGPPVASKPGWYMNKFTGHALGKNWSGPSGAMYRMSEEGTGFGRFVGWRKV